MTTADYCAALKRRLKITSDYALAKALRVSKQRVSNYVNGQRVFDNTMAARVAELLELDPMQVIADCELERGSAPDLWKRLRSAAAMVLAALGALVSSPHDARAAFDTTPYCGSVSTAPSGGGIPVRHATGIHIAALRRRVVGFVRWCALAWLALSFCSL